MTDDIKENEAAETAALHTEAAEGTEVCETCCCSEKKTYRTEAKRRRLINRLSRLEGQIRGIRGMVERDAYCNDILIQTTAVASALDAFDRELFTEHVRTCVVRDLTSGDEAKAAAVIDEMTDMIRRLTR